MLTCFDFTFVEKAFNCYGYKRIDEKFLLYIFLTVLIENKCQNMPTNTSYSKLVNITETAKRLV